MAAKTTYTTSAVRVNGEAPTTFTRKSARLYTHAVLVRAERKGEVIIYVAQWCSRIDLAITAERATRNRLNAYYAAQPEEGTLLACWWQPIREEA